MIPPKYKFYIGKSFVGIQQMIGTGIDNSGQFTDEADKCIYLYANPSWVVSPIFIGLQSIDRYNSIFFYDAKDALISYTPLAEYDSQVIIPPHNTKWWAIRFTLSDPNFLLKKDTTFIYSANSVNPHYKELNKRYSKENGQEFFRASIDGKVTLFGKDCDIVLKSDIESLFAFIIEKYDRTSNRWVEYYKGEFSKADCKLDYSKKSCEIKTNPIDEYTEIINGYENTYDLVKLAPELSKINLHKRSLTQIYIAGSNSITNFFGGTYWEADVNEAVDNKIDLINKYYFAYIKACNEFEIKGAEISDVNGVYAGDSGVWNQQKGYSVKTTKVISVGDKIQATLVPTVYDLSSNASRLAKTKDSNISGTKVFIENLYRLQLIKSSTSSVIYESDTIFYISSADDVHIDRKTIQMINKNDNLDSFIIDSPFVYRIFRRLLCDVESIEIENQALNTYEVPSDDFVSDNRNYKRCIGLNGGSIFCTSFVVDEPTRYGVNDYNKYFSNKFISSTLGIERPLPISRNSWANASLWYVYDKLYPIWEKKLRKLYTIKDNYSISAVIKSLLKKINPTISHEGTSEYSNFLYGNMSPISGIDRFYVYITQKTNILKGDYDQHAQKAEISLKNVMDMLRDCFRCYWYIENNKLKIEHISFFMKGGSYSQNASIQLDFTNLFDQFNNKAISAYQSEIEFDKSDLNSRYEFSWMDDATHIFGGVTIDVKSNYIQKDKTETVSINNFSSDVDYMLFNPLSFSSDGFALLCPVKNGNTLELPIAEVELKDENGEAFKAIAQNFYASWPYLVRFYMWDMPAEKIECNSVENLIVHSIKMCMKHDINITAEADLDILKLIKTFIGNGRIDRAQYNINTRNAKIKLSYIPI